MRTYHAIILKENKKETTVVTTEAKNLSEAKEKFQVMGKLICLGGSSKIYL